MKAYKVHQSYIAQTEQDRIMFEKIIKAALVTLTATATLFLLTKLFAKLIKK
ncbi:MAG: hypothetical protein LBM41_06225 [Ruminococcus sp.]|jgi:hypothetical protein|nr:hypothetical protein [Ruminococcus sp.]